MHIQKHIYFLKQHVKNYYFNLDIIYPEYWCNFIDFSRAQL